MKVLIAGSRNIKDFKIVKEAVQEFINDTDISITEIVSGMANGVDTLGCFYSQFNNLPLKEFPANWNLYGKKAGFLRNEQMGDYANALIAIWLNQSKGTKHMIKYMLKLNKPVYIKIVENNGNTFPLIKVTKNTNLDNIKNPKEIENFF